MIDPKTESLEAIRLQHQKLSSDEKSSLEKYDKLLMEVDKQRKKYNFDANEIIDAVYKTYIKKLLDAPNNSGSSFKLQSVLALLKNARKYNLLTIGCLNELYEIVWKEIETFKLNKTVIGLLQQFPDTYYFQKLSFKHQYQSEINQRLFERYKDAFIMIFLLDNLDREAPFEYLKKDKEAIAKKAATKRALSEINDVKELIKWIETWYENHPKTFDQRNPLMDFGFSEWPDRRPAALEIIQELKKISQSEKQMKAEFKYLQQIWEDLKNELGLSDDRAFQELGKPSYASLFAPGWPIKNLPASGLVNTEKNSEKISELPVSAVTLVPSGYQILRSANVASEAHSISEIHPPAMPKPSAPSILPEASAPIPMGEPEIKSTADVLLELRSDTIPKLEPESKNEEIVVGSITLLLVPNNASIKDMSIEQLLATLPSTENLPSLDDEFEESEEETEAPKRQAQLST